MKLINYISNIAIPISIVVILLCGLREKNNIFDLFLEGAKDGSKLALKLFPTLVGLFLAINLLNQSGIINLIMKLISPIVKTINFPIEILPLAILRPISGSGAIATATNIMKQYGVDSKIGIIAAVIMGSTETTLYVMSVYTSSVKIKRTRGVLLAAFVADFVGIISSIIIIQKIF